MRRWHITMPEELYLELVEGARHQHIAPLVAVRAAINLWLMWARGEVTIRDKRGREVVLAA
mgnify:CR=1 FL=1